MINLDEQVIYHQVKSGMWTCQSLVCAHKFLKIKSHNYEYNKNLVSQVELMVASAPKCKLPSEFQKIPNQLVTQK